MPRWPDRHELDEDSLRASHIRNIRIKADINCRFAEHQSQANPEDTGYRLLYATWLNTQLLAEIAEDLRERNLREDTRYPNLSKTSALEPPVR